MIINWNWHSIVNKTIKGDVYFRICVYVNLLIVFQAKLSNAWVSTKFIYQVWVALAQCWHNLGYAMNNTLGQRRPTVQLADGPTLAQQSWQHCPNISPTLAEPHHVIKDAAR